MNSGQTAQPLFQGNVFLIVLGVVFAAGLYLLLQLYFRKTPAGKKGPSGFFFFRLFFPLAILILIFLFKVLITNNILPAGEKFLQYLDAALVFLVIYLILRILDVSVQLRYSRRQIPFPLPKVIHSFILAVLYIIVLFFILKGILQIDITPFLATSAILTMILGLALQGTLSNIVSGISLHMTKSYVRGDWIKVGEKEGKVIEINWRETKVMDRNSNIIVIPNNVASSEIFINYSQPDNKTALTFPVKVSYDAPSTAVVDALKEAAADVPEVLASPAPEVYAKEYDDYGVSYTLKFWITDFARKNPILGKVGQLIWYKLKRRNIEIPVPVSERVADVLRSVQEMKGVFIGDEEPEKNYKDLVNSELLHYWKDEAKEEPLISEEQIKELARTVSRLTFSPGEIVFKQGEKGDSCYIVASGRLKGIITYKDKGKDYVKEFIIEPGGIFGEMSLFTGMPRTATGTVEEESVLLELNTKDFAQFLAKSPKAAERIAEIVSLRNSKNQEFFKKIKELSASDIKESCSKHSILERLKNLVHRWTG